MFKKMIPTVVVSSISVTGLYSCISAEKKEIASSLSISDINENIGNNIRLVKITSTDVKKRTSECTGVFVGEKTIITLAACVHNGDVLVHGVKPNKVFISADYRNVYSQSGVALSALTSVDNLAVLTFGDKLPQPLAVAELSGNELTDMLKNSGEYYFYQVARNNEERMNVKNSYSEEKSLTKSTAYFFPKQIVKGDKKYYEVETNQVINFDTKVGDAGSPLIAVEGSRVRIVGLGAIIKEAQGYNWPEKFISMPINMNDQTMKTFADAAQLQTGASFEYLSR